MIIVNKIPLTDEALNDKSHKLYNFARFYEDTLAELRKNYTNGYIRFKRPGFPKYTKGADNAGREIPKMKEPTPPMRIPLKGSAVVGTLGKQNIACCLDEPTILPGNLWDLGVKRAITVKEDYLVNITAEPDLAFYLYKISKFTQRGLLKVVDPKADDAKIGEEEMELTERKYAVWSMLTDVEKLKTMARAYGVSEVDKKQPNAIRKELEALLERNDKAKRQNPALKGTKEFIEEMKVTDGLLLRNFIQKAIDEKKLVYKPDGRWRIGEKVVVQVPASELSRTREYLCNFLMAGNNTEKYQEFLKDLINKEYLDKITETKEWVWLAKVSGHNPSFKKLEETKQVVYSFYCPV